MKEIQNFLKNLLIDEKKGFAPVPKSAAFISPGDVLYFHYDSGLGSEERGVLVVSNDRGQGLFLSTRKKVLLSVFNLHTSPPEIVKMILKSLYKNRSLSNYYHMKGSLGVILGTKNYRTYDTNKMQNTYKILINTSLY